MYDLISRYFKGELCTLITVTTENHPISAKEYVQSVYETVIHRNPYENEFHQAIKEILDSLVPVFEKHPKYMEHGILERIVEPERVVYFRVPWVDDKGKVRVNRGYRAQFNSALGPYKGGRSAAKACDSTTSSCSTRIGVFGRDLTATATQDRERRARPAASASERDQLAFERHVGLDQVFGVEAPSFDVGAVEGVADARQRDAVLEHRVELQLMARDALRAR